MIGHISESEGQNEGVIEAQGQQVMMMMMMMMVVVLVVEVTIIIFKIIILLVTKLSFISSTIPPSHTLLRGIIGSKDMAVKPFDCQRIIIIIIIGR